MRSPISQQLRPDRAILNYPTFARQSNLTTWENLQLGAVLNQSYSSDPDVQFQIPSSFKLYDACTVRLKIVSGMQADLGVPALLFLEQTNAFVGTDRAYGDVGLFADSINQNNIFSGNSDTHDLNYVPSMLDFTTMAAKLAINPAFNVVAFPLIGGATQRLLYYFHLQVIVYKW